MLSRHTLVPGQVQNQLHYRSDDNVYLSEYLLVLSIYPKVFHIPMYRKIQLLSKVITSFQDEPLDSMFNVIHGIGYSSSNTAWIID